MMPPKCYTWLESCGSQLSDGKNEKLFFCILQSVGFSRTLRTDIFLYTEKLSYAKICILFVNSYNSANIFGKKVYILALLFARRKKYRKNLRYILQNAKINEKNCGIFCRAQKILQKLAQK